MLKLSKLHFSKSGVCFSKLEPASLVRLAGICSHDPCDDLGDEGEYMDQDPSCFDDDQMECDDTNDVYFQKSRSGFRAGNNFRKRSSFRGQSRGGRYGNRPPYHHQQRSYPPRISPYAQQGLSAMKCYSCGERGHLIKDCKAPRGSGKMANGRGQGPLQADTKNQRRQRFNSASDDQFQFFQSEFEHHIYRLSSTHGKIPKHELQNFTRSSNTRTRTWIHCT